MTESMFSFISILEHHYPPGDLGELSPNMEMKVVDIESGDNLPENRHGEIWLRGPIMFKGYHNNENATKRTIDEDGWLHTGDFGHYDENGHLFITDQVTELIKFRIWFVFPTEIEACLLEHDAIAEVAVIGIKHIVDVEWPRAYVKLKQGKKISEEKIKKYVAGNI